MTDPAHSKAFLLGLFETGLGVARALGREGIQVDGYDHKKDIAWYSKYVSPKLCPHPVKEEERFIKFLIDEADKSGSKPVLYVTADDFIPAIINNMSLLNRHLLINMPDSATITNVSDKYELYLTAKRHGIPVPETVKVDSAGDLDSVSKLAYPVFVKGASSNEWREAFGGSRKGFVFSSRDEFLRSSDTLLGKRVSLIVQEIIKGPDTNHYKFCGYVDKSGNLTAGFCLRKTRQTPIHFGIGCCVVSVDNPQVRQIGSDFFRAIDYSGVGSAEFKLDERDNKYKLIELNPRYWQQNSLAAACGVNFPLIQYNDLISRSDGQHFDYATGVNWLNIYSDFDSFLAYRKEGSLTFGGWLKSLKGRRVYSDWALDDIVPGFYEVGFGKRLTRLPRYFLKKIKRS